MSFGLTAELLQDGQFPQEEIESALQRYDSRERGAWPIARFPPALEKAWWCHHAIESLPVQRWAILFAFAFYIAYFATTWAEVAENFDPYLGMIFLIFGTPGNTALLLATFINRGWNYTRSIATFGAIWHTCGLGLFYLRCQELSLAVPTEFLVVVIYFDLYLLGLGFLYGAMLAALALCLSPLAVSITTGAPAEATATMFFIFAAAIIGSVGAFLAERTQRISWLRSLLLSHIADHDGLTNLLNRTAFHNRADILLRQADRTRSTCAMLTIDVDHFKQFNDRFGHPAGDECLRLVGREVGKTGRRPLDLMGRLGGEEFGILLFGATTEQSMSMGQGLTERIRKIQSPDGSTITASIGISGYVPRNDSLDGVLLRSDAALYKAKNSGRNQICTA